MYKFVKIINLYIYNHGTMMRLVHHVQDNASVRFVEVEVELELEVEQEWGIQRHKCF